MGQSELITRLEALLFVAAGPLSAAELAAASEAAEEDVSSALESLAAQLSTRGLRLTSSGLGYQLATAPELSELVERFLGNQARADLSRPALETLAIIIYRQPVTKPQIEEIRGIASEQTLRNLLQRELIIEAGRSSEPGRPVTYRPSHRLLHHLGLSSYDELPSLEQLGLGDYAD